MPKKQKQIEKPNSTVSRPPIVVIMGHVDHGKTSLLDAIRSADVASKEHGGITQSIGAYQITLPATPDPLRSEASQQPVTITFIDTPGHQAFTKMRSRGAKVADIAILVVAANDSVMPQTIESIKIIKDAKIPYIVAINKVDLPEANIDKVIQDLLRHEVLLENYGGDVPWAKVSALKKTGIKELLDLVYLLWQMQETKSDANAPLEAIVIESKLDKNRGPVASVIVRNGTLKTAEKIYIDGVESKIRGLFDYLQKPIKEAPPGTPVEVIGLSKVPSTGSLIGTSPQLAQGASLHISSEVAKSNRTLPSETNRLNIILRADTIGSLEALLASIPENINLIDSGVGQITAKDIITAKTTKSIVLGFNVEIDSTAKSLQESEKVLIRTYKIIYELLEELTDAAAGVLTLDQEEVLGAGKIIAQFPFEKTRIAGTKVTEGRLARGDTIKILRGEEVVGESKVKSLRVGKDEINKVESGKECGVLFDPQVDFTLSDTIQAYKKY